jgi:hypothetical protein
MKKLEAKLQKKLVNYIKANWPDVYFHADAAPQRNQLGTLAKIGYKSGHPDLFIYTARHGYHGFAIELKKDGEFVYRKSDPSKLLKKREEQSIVLKKLKAEGYLASFVIGWGEAKAAIDWYLSNQQK